MRLDLPSFDDFDGLPPVARRHICYGEGGGAEGPNPPDYSAYIALMSQIGNEGRERATKLFEWAQQAGINLQDIAAAVGKAATAAAGSQQATSDRLMADWEKTYQPLYEAQAADAQRMIGELPATEEKYAGKFGADTAVNIDRALAASRRDLQSRGMAAAPIGQGALDTTAAIQRAAAITGASETGRYGARNEARTVTGQALQQGQFLPGVAGQQAGLAVANRNQAFMAPTTAAAASAQLYNPSLGYYNAALPYYRQWFDATAKGYDQQLAKFAAEQAADQGGSFMNTVLPAIIGAAGTIGGNYAFGSSLPTGTSTGGTGIGGGGGGGTGIGPGTGYTYAKGGAINLVPPDASPSGGSEVDDVHAMVSEGEFIIPERTVDWLGEKFFQNLIMKTDKEREAQTVAAPEPGGAEAQQAVDMTPPMFRSEGART